MPLKLKSGDVFPDVTLTDDTGAAVSISAVADGNPLILSFYRGPW